MKAQPVLIVGGGMVGAALALDLGRHQVPVRLLEAKPPAPIDANEPPRLRVSALNRRSIDYLQTIGAWEALNPQRLADFDSLSAWDISGDGRLEFSAEELGLERLGTFIENEHLQGALLAIAAEQKTVQLEAPAPSLTVQWDQYDLVVAADGAGSPLREKAGIGVWSGDYGQHAVVATVLTDPPAARATWQRFTPEGPQALLPLVQGAASLVWYVGPTKAEELLAQSDADFIAAFETAFPPELGRISTLYGRGAFPIRRLHAKRYWQDNLVLVGDSAHVIHPLAGQGVNLGLRDARALAEQIIKARDAGLPLSHPSMLAAYEQARRPDNQLMQSIMTGFHVGFTASLGPFSPLRSWGLSLAGHGGWLKRAVLRYALDGRTNDHHQVDGHTPTE